MSKFNQAEFESKAKKLVAEYLNYAISEKDVFIVWFCKVGANAKAMLRSDQDYLYHYFEITYFGEEGKYVVDAYGLSSVGTVLGEKSNDTSTSHLQIGVDKVTASVETKCPICQEHHDILGLTEAFDLYIKEDILFLKNKSARKDVFKIKYCPFCGRKL